MKKAPPDPIYGIAVFIFLLIPCLFFPPLALIVVPMLWIYMYTCKKKQDKFYGDDK
jgi:protein-S-isoprenylcysteine O-methyltransferase Ste14